LTRRSLLALGAGLSLQRFGEARAATQKQIAPGTRFETPMRLLDSGTPGPTVLIVAGIHGNEPAPPRAACRIATPSRGRLWIVPEANRTALKAHSRFTPGEAHGDLNRNFPTARRPTPRGALAEALWNATVQVDPDWVLDLHEGWGYSARGRSMGSSIVAPNEPRAATEPIARRLLARINETIERTDKRFKLLRPGPNGSFARAVNETLGRPALVFETTWVEPMELRIAQQLLLVEEALAALGMRDEDSIHRRAEPLCPAG
jgi:predicted deacylase